MYLSYYQHPELQLLDAERCREYAESPKCELLKAMRMDSREVLSDVKGHNPRPRDEFADMLQGVFAEGWMADAVKNIYYPSHTFDAALEKSHQVFDEMIRKPSNLIDVHEDCCFITGQHRKVKTFILFQQTYEDGWNQYYLIETVEGMMTFFCIYGMKADRETLRAHFIWRPEHEHPCFDGVSDVDAVWWRLEMVYGYLIFKRYSDVELEVVCREKTLRKSGILHEKVNNFMGINVTLLDSRWFTTICRNEGFAVRGHFRLQPYKNNGVWDRKLIYINPYTKNGYHRVASIANIDNK